MTIELKAVCELEQTVTFGLFYKTAGGGKYKENKQKEGRKISVNLFKLVWEFEKGGRRGREREKQRKRERNTENLFTLL